MARNSRHLPLLLTFCSIALFVFLFYAVSDDSRQRRVTANQRAFYRDCLLKNYGPPNQYFDKSTLDIAKPDECGLSEASGSVSFASPPIHIKTFFSSSTVRFYMYEYNGEYTWDESISISYRIIPF